MNVIVNGESFEVADRTAIGELIATLGLSRDRVAVEVNGQIVRKTAWSDKVLRDGDRIEIVHFVGGG